MHKYLIRISLLILFILWISNSYALWDDNELYRKQKDFNVNFIQQVCKTFQSYTNFNPFIDLEAEEIEKLNDTVNLVHSQLITLRVNDGYLLRLNRFCSNPEDSREEAARYLFYAYKIALIYYVDSLWYKPTFSGSEINDKNFMNWVNNNRLFIEEQVHTIMMPPIEIRKLMKEVVPPLKEDENYYFTNHDFLDNHFPIYWEFSLFDWSEKITNFKLEWEIRKMLSFKENIPIDKISDQYEKMLFGKGLEIWKNEKWYIWNEEELMQYIKINEKKILEQSYLSLLRWVRTLGYPINKNVKFYDPDRRKYDNNPYSEENYQSPVYKKLPYDIYIHNRNFQDYIYDYKTYFIFGFLVFVGILWGILFNIFHKIHRHRKKSLEKPDEKEEKSKDKMNSWSELSKGDKVALYILALIIPPLLIWVLSISFFEEPIIIKNPWVDSVLFFWLIKLYFTRKYNHIITTWLIIVIIWHVFINILLTSQL